MEIKITKAVIAIIKTFIIIMDHHLTVNRINLGINRKKNTNLVAKNNKMKKNYKRCMILMLIIKDKIIFLLYSMIRIRTIY